MDWSLDVIYLIYTCKGDISMIYIFNQIVAEKWNQFEPFSYANYSLNSDAGGRRLGGKIVNGGKSV